MLRPKFLLAFLAISAALLAQPAYAHGFGERYDLPVPLSYFMVGGGAAVVLSFAMIGLVVKGEAQRFSYPRFNLIRHPLSRLVLAGPVILPIKMFAVFLLGLIVAVAVFGDPRPSMNFAPTFIWVIWWVGMGFFVALFGNLWALVNPWKAIYGWAEGLYAVIRSDGEFSYGRDYPKKLGIWPAVALLFAFAWAENAYVGSAEPRRLAAMVLTYSVITFGGMFLFGKHRWLKHGEVFSVVFGYLARFSITEVRVIESEVCELCSSEACSAQEQGDGCVDCYECAEYADEPQFDLRPPAVGLNNIGTVGGDVLAMVILILAMVTFDGFGATPEWVEVQSKFVTWFPGLTREWLNGVTIANTMGLVGIPLAFALVYFGFAHLMGLMTGSQLTASTLAKAFVFSLIPIALAYNFAHFLSFLLIQGQLIIPLVSDPFGFDWNLFGTRDYLIDIGITNARFIWFFSIAVIVIGHMIAVYLAHIRAIALFTNKELVLKSQLPMLGLMVIYTIVSLWIVSRPIVE
jgi:hypothetical protein